MPKNIPRDTYKTRKTTCSLIEEFQNNENVREKSRIVPKTIRSPVRWQKVSFLVKIERGFDRSKLEKSGIEKTLVQRKPDFKTGKIILKTLKMPKFVEEDPLGLLNVQFIAKDQKISKKEEPFGDIKNI